MESDVEEHNLTGTSDDLAMRGVICDVELEIPKVSSAMRTFFTNIVLVLV